MKIELLATRLDYQRSNFKKKIQPIWGYLFCIIVFVFWSGFFTSIALSFILDLISVRTSTKVYSSDTEINLFCYVLNQKNSQFVAKTWGKRCKRFVLLHTKPLKNKWKEEQEALRHIYLTYRFNYDWFIRADANSYVFVDNLKQMLSNYSYSKDRALGYDMSSNSKNKPSVNYILNHSGLRSLVELGVTKLCNNIRANELDQALKICMKVSNIETVHNDHGRVISRTDLRHFNSTHFISIKESSSSIVLIHNMEPSDMYLTEFLMYHMKPNKEKSK